MRSRRLRGRWLKVCAAYRTSLRQVDLEVTERVEGSAAPCAVADGVFAVAGEEDPVGFAGGGLELEAVGAFVEEGLVVALDFAGDVPGAEVGGGEEGDGVRLVFASGVECEVGGAVEVLEEELGVAVFGGEVEDDGVFLVALEGSSVL